MKAAARKLPPDFWFFVAVVVLVAGGVLMVFDASYARAGDRGMGDAWYFVKRQMVYAAVGFLGLFVAMKIHPGKLRKITNTLIGISFGLLILVMVPGLGKSIGGAARWIPLGPFHLQPSEVAKLAVVLYLAEQMATGGLKVRRFESLFKPIAVVGGISLLVLMEPDMGTAMAIIFTTTIMFFVAGVKKRHMLGLAGIGALLCSLIIAVEPYRLDRVKTWLNPWADPLGDGYQIIHSLIALGTGGFLGQGPCLGREKFFIPAPQTDMIGTTLAEEAGFIGMLVLLGLFILFTYRGLCIGHRAKCPYMSLLAIGLTSMVSIQAVMNIAVFTASMPMTGVPLPFISYGGSYLLAMLFGSGIVLSVSRHLDETVVNTESEAYEGRNNGRRDRRAYLSCTEYRPTTKKRRSRTTLRR